MKWFQQTFTLRIDAYDDSEGCIKCYFCVTNAWISGRLKLGRRGTVTRAMHLFKNPLSSIVEDCKTRLHILQLSS